MTQRYVFITLYICPFIYYVYFVFLSCCKICYCSRNTFEPSEQNTILTPFCAPVLECSDSHGGFVCWVFVWLFVGFFNFYSISSLKSEQCETASSDVVRTSPYPSLSYSLITSFKLCGSRCRLHNCLEKGKPTESLVSYFPFQ